MQAVVATAEVVRAEVVGVVDSGAATDTALPSAVPSAVPVFRAAS